MLIILPISAQTFETDDFSDLTSAMQTAGSQPDENHIFNINGNMDFTSAIREALNMELLGSNTKNRYELNLNDFSLTFTGGDKSSKISDLKINATSTNGGIISQNQTLTINNSTLTGHTNQGKELVRNTNGALIVNESNFLNNNASQGAGIYFSGTNLNADKSEFSGNTSTQGGAIYVKSGTYVDQYYEDGSAFWMRPYVNLESFHLSGGFHYRKPVIRLCVWV